MIRCTAYGSHNRFGGTTERKRRCYKYFSRKGSYYPLDERLGWTSVGLLSISPFLQVLFGSTRPFGEFIQVLGEAQGFLISFTAAQWNTEHAGQQLEHDPYAVVKQKWRMRAYEELIVQMDSTTSPQILPIEEITGREKLKALTEWKMCYMRTAQRS